MPQGATSGQAPKVLIAQADVEPVATAGNSLNTDIYVVPGTTGDTYTLTEVTYSAKADITGAATNHRRFDLINTGTDGNGTTAVATLIFSSGAVTALDDDEKAITITAVAADKIIPTGAVLQWQSTAVGTGITDPGGLVKVVLDRD